MRGRVTQVDLVTWPSKVGDHYLHITCKKDEVIVVPNFSRDLWKNTGGYPPPLTSIVRLHNRAVTASLPASYGYTISGTATRLSQHPYQHCTAAQHGSHSILTSIVRLHNTAVTTSLPALYGCTISGTATRNTQTQKNTIGMIMLNLIGRIRSGFLYLSEWKNKCRSLSPKFSCM